MSATSKPISSDEELEEALRQLASLVDRDPTPDSEDGKVLWELATRIETYEHSRYETRRLTYPEDNFNTPLEGLNEPAQENLKIIDLYSVPAPWGSIENTPALEALDSVQKDLGSSMEDILKMVMVDEATYEKWVNDPLNQPALKNLEKLWLLMQFCSSMESILGSLESFRDDSELQNLLNEGKFDEARTVIVKRIALRRTLGYDGSMPATYDDIDLLEEFN